MHMTMHTTIKWPSTSPSHSQCADHALEHVQVRNLLNCYQRTGDMEHCLALQPLQKMTLRGELKRELHLIPYPAHQTQEDLSLQVRRPA